MQHSKVHRDISEQFSANLDQVRRTRADEKEKSDPSTAVYYVGGAIALLSTAAAVGYLAFHKSKIDFKGDE